ncbi:hypothetical protein PHYSODRAFT_514298 [Phytophthora sojae]|uniref:Necrosis inducing-like protein NPP1 type n=1 Tax=Phytophthora sojae (strain P6497) TaxID=1094619 RepID=G4ZUF0_PHYSP|nr:hypothetical protein PHYSODRAFT_514298 [Phytophthora sojae]EGZ13424.1 hypothetical protein PHYSODRAFT_514298 [Phytophthora sojae]|eukprot:XP_009530853.1 hypothetical protein PHYSODRAFT_514298 [Phytophthora sojae]
MKLGLPFAIALSALVAAQAAVIDYDKVQPFPELEPKTISEKAAIKYKPSLAIKDGCRSYAAVNAAGDTSGGMDPMAPDGGTVEKNPYGHGCRGSVLGSQVYSRSGWYRDVWAIMYAWYFPRDISWYEASYPPVRHDWINTIVWLNNPALENPSLLGVSASREDAEYVAYPPTVKEFMNGTHPKMEYFMGFYVGGYHTIDVSLDAGDFQDLVHWSQLTDQARKALETADFGVVTPVPFNDVNFEKNLERGWYQNDTILEHKIGIV